MERERAKSESSSAIFIFFILRRLQHRWCVCAPMSLSFVVLYFLWLKPSLFVVVLPCDAIEPSPPFSFSLVHLLLMAIAEPFLRQCHDVPESGFSSLVQLGDGKKRKSINVVRREQCTLKALQGLAHQNRVEEKHPKL
ncbi:uncharacterized protein LOC129285367 isoform X1 [Prosopis cineraria]|uniref:uncharacterized protein LOC129285367 isoform X1 n=1 Tax=Prosopis cineraria TaxID=364024 RepID=UPI00240F05AB|nr:uncharacterized protein LOC129285367 isoform X1 [Prosopis cineraria]